MYPRIRTLGGTAALACLFFAASATSARERPGRASARPALERESRRQSRGQEPRQRRLGEDRRGGPHAGGGREQARLLRVRQPELRRLPPHAGPALPRLRLRGAPDRNGARSSCATTFRRPSRCRSSTASPRRPSVLITTPEGRLVFLMQGFKDAPDFYRHAHKDLDHYRQFAKKVDAQDVATLSGRTRRCATGRELYARKDPKAALPRLERAVGGPESAARACAKRARKPGRRRARARRPAASRETIDQLIATTKNPDQKERAELFRGADPARRRTSPPKPWRSTRSSRRITPTPSTSSACSPSSRGSRAPPTP